MRFEHPQGQALPAPPPAGVDETLEHPGIVQSIGDGRAKIAIAVAGCSACGRKSGCGVGRLAGNGRTTLLELPAPDGLRPGDRVTLCIEPSAVNRAALLGYLVPAVLIVIGAAGGDLVRPGDAGAALGALIGLAAGLAAAPIIAGCIGRHFEKSHLPVILAKALPDD